ncbi:hypothetical protein B0A55_00261 [Friedmanniomyces simplex]|uniref:DUF7932 domain-containing protein n=1 Tax=Friedmanniomyces simplex TaxID=329884 RepID=A0A4U0Y3G5_9PEZI|nr:hypothetical protein B0A55_00261 [Friedmanniomyces simplex]
MTDSPIVISVDGRHGSDLSSSRPSRQDCSRALVRTGHHRDRDGQDGIDAAPPVNGGPGGLLVVELSESEQLESHLHAAVVRSDSWQQPVPAVDIPHYQDLLLSSAGGEGEDGLTGGDGQSGLPGIKGVAASRETDATDGTDGGNGGRSRMESLGKEVQEVREEMVMSGSNLWVTNTICQLELSPNKLDAVQECPWKLRLVSFDIEDENGDGIFEPGEHVIVRRIRISNIGGMPSPLKRIQLHVRPSKHFVPDHAVQLSIPPSIAPDTTITFEGVLRARINTPTDVSHAGKRFRKPGVRLSIAATLPWLNRTLPDFDFERSFDIQFPCAFSNTDNLASVHPGSCSSLTFAVMNFGNHAIGSEAKQSREIQIQLTVPAEHGTLSDDRTQILDEVILDMPVIGPKASESLSQALTFLPEVQAPLRLHVTLALYIADPSYGAADDASDRASDQGLILVHTIQLLLQISELYRYRAASEVLMVVNSKTPPERIVALRELIRRDLGMIADFWDVDLNGGLHINKDGRTENVLSMYDGKTVLLLGENFQFFTAKSRTIVEMCDSRAVRRSIAAGTSYLALGLAGEKACKTFFQRAVFDVPCPVADVGSDIPDSARFPNANVLAHALVQQKQNQNISTTMFMLPIRRRWYHVLGPSAKRQAESTSRRLRRRLPQSRCLVTTTQSTSQNSMEGGESAKTDHGQVLVLLGADRSAPLRATEKTRDRDNKLSAFEKYMIISSLTSKRRAHLIWSDATPVGGDFPFVTDAAICSLAADCVVDITIYAYSAFRMGSVDMPPATSPNFDRYCYVLKRTVQYLFHEQAECRKERGEGRYQYAGRCEANSVIEMNGNSL